MNRLIESILTGLVVNGQQIPFSYLFYQGHGEPYVVYTKENEDDSLTADDELQGWVMYYDFDVYARGNYRAIFAKLRELLEDNGFVWQVSRSSAEMYDEETEYYHRTYNFAYLYEEED